jgi:hypothetical protein
MMSASEASHVKDARKLRELALWYRAFAERTANATIWDARLRMADDLEMEAERMERDGSLNRPNPDHSHPLDHAKKENP